jgi:hypothetical protein
MNQGLTRPLYLYLMMKGIFTLLLLMAGLVLTAQDDAWKQNRWVFGGNAALAFGTDFTVIGAAPTVGYRFTERITAGGGGLYFYQRWRTWGGGMRSTQIYGPQGFARIRLANNLISEGDRLFLQSDYYLVNTEAFSLIDQRFDRVWVAQWFVGGGYFMQVGRNMFAGLMVMWDVIDDRRAPFPNPMIRGGVSFGL